MWCSIWLRPNMIIQHTYHCANTQSPSMGVTACSVHLVAKGLYSAVWVCASVCVRAHTCLCLKGLPLCGFAWHLQIGDSAKHSVRQSLCQTFIHPSNLHRPASRVLETHWNTLKHTVRLFKVIYQLVATVLAVLVAACLFLNSFLHAGCLSRHAWPGDDLTQIPTRSQGQLSLQASVVLALETQTWTHFINNTYWVWLTEKIP